MARARTQPQPTPKPSSRISMNALGWRRRLGHPVDAADGQGDDDRHGEEGVDRQVVDELCLTVHPQRGDVREEDQGKRQGDDRPDEVVAHQHERELAVRDAAVGRRGPIPPPDLPGTVQVSMDAEICIAGVSIGRSRVFGACRAIKDLEIHPGSPATPVCVGCASSQLTDEKHPLIRVRKRLMRFQVPLIPSEGKIEQRSARSSRVRPGMRRDFRRFRSDKGVPVPRDGRRSSGVPDRNDAESGRPPGGADRGLGPGAVRGIAGRPFRTTASSRRVPGEFRRVPASRGPPG